jgi:hypothetical protein
VELDTVQHDHGAMVKRQQLAKATHWVLGLFGTTFVPILVGKNLQKGVFGTAPRTLLHKLHYGAVPQKTRVRGVSL